MAFSGPACGRRSELLSLSAVRFRTTSHEVGPLLITVGWLREKPNPFWECELPACFESIVLCVRPSPSGFVSYSHECTELYAASKCSFVDIEQGRWGVSLTQRGAVQKGVSPNAPNHFGQPKLLQLRAVGKGAPQNLTDMCL